MEMATMGPSALVRLNDQMLPITNYFDFFVETLLLPTGTLVVVSGILPF